MEEFQVGSVGTENQFPYRENSIHWDRDTNITAVICSSEVQVKDPFIIHPLQIIRMEEKKLLGYEELGKVDLNHSQAYRNCVKDPYILFPEMNVREGNRNVEHCGFSPMFFGRKFLTILTTDGITRVYEKSESDPTFHPHHDLHPLLMKESFGLPKSDLRRPRPKEDPMLSTDFSKWSHISDDVKTKVGYRLIHRGGAQRAIEEEETYGRPEISRQQKKTHSKKKKKRRKRRKRRYTTPKKKKPIEPEPERIIDSGEYISEDNEITESEIHEMCKFFYNTYVPKLSKQQLRKERKKDKSQRWLIFPMINKEDWFEETRVKMWEDQRFNQFEDSREIEQAVIDKEIKRRVRYFLREEEDPPEDYLDLPLDEIFRRNLVVDKKIRKRRVFKPKRKKMVDEEEEEEEIVQKENKIPENVNLIVISSGEEDPKTDGNFVPGGYEEEEEEIVEESESEDSDSEEHAQRKIPLLLKEYDMLDRGVAFPDNRSQTGPRKKRFYVSEALFHSKLDCINTTCSEWCEIIEDSRTMVDEEEEEEEEEDEEEFESKTSYQVFGTRSGMIVLLSCRISQDRTKQIDYKFINFFRAHPSRICALHYCKENVKNPFLVSSGFQGSVKIWGFQFDGTKKKRGRPRKGSKKSGGGDPRIVLKSEVFQRDGIPTRILKTQRIDVPSPSVIQLVFPKGTSLIVVKLSVEGERIGRMQYRAHKGFITGLCLTKSLAGRLVAFTTSYEGVLARWDFSELKHFRVTLLHDESQQENFFWGADWSPNKTHILVPSDVNIKEFRLKPLFRRNIWKLFPVSTKPEMFLSSLINIRDGQKSSGVSSSTSVSQTSGTSEGNVSNLSDVIRLIENCVGDEEFVSFANDFQKIGEQRRDYWFNKLLFSILQKMKHRVDQNDHLRTVNKKSEFLLRYMWNSKLFHQMLEEKKSLEESNGLEDERHFEMLVNLSDWIVSYHLEMASGSSRSVGMKCDPHIPSYVQNLNLIEQQIYPHSNNNNNMSVVISAIRKSIQTGIRIELERAQLNPIEEEEEVIRIPPPDFQSREKCPICGCFSVSSCEDLFGSHCKCSAKSHIYDRDVYSFQVIDAVLNVKKCEYCGAKTILEYETCPICVGMLKENERELLESYS